MIHEPAKITTYEVVVKRNGVVWERYDEPTREEALMGVGNMRSDRPDETIELITTEVFQ